MPVMESSMPATETGKADIEGIRAGLKKEMEHKVGIIRCGDSLKDCLEKIKNWDIMLSGSLRDRASIELKNMLTIAALVTDSALKRRESRGAHYRSDFQDTDDKHWKKPIIVQK